MNVKAVPEGYHTVTPYLVVKGAGRVIDFVKQAFDADVQISLELPGGVIAHGEATIGDSKVMISEARGDMETGPTSLYLYVGDCDAVYAKAVAAGGESIMEPADMFYGDRHGGVTDPAGNQWWIATHIEDVAAEELEQRMEEWKKQNNP